MGFLDYELYKRHTCFSAFWGKLGPNQLDEPPGRLVGKVGAFRVPRVPHNPVMTRADYYLLYLSRMSWEIPCSFKLFFFPTRTIKGLHFVAESVFVFRSKKIFLGSLVIPVSFKFIETVRSFFELLRVGILLICLHCASECNCTFQCHLE